MPRPKKTKVRIKQSPILPAKVGKVREIKDLKGDVIFVGTEKEWQAWARSPERHGTFSTNP